jgi:transcriptional regulator with GAF, ATPase, and Fis domain
MSSKTDTLDIGTPPTSQSERKTGLVTLFASDPSALPSAVVLESSPLVIGREPPKGGLAIALGSVSRNHARLARRGEELFVDDLDSRNGTFVNGRRARHAVVVHGDELRIGEVMFRIDEEQPERFLDFPLAGIELPKGVDGLLGGVMMEAVRKDILRTAKTELSILVLGESGTGKELVARALHDLSGRSGTLAAVNCAAIPAALLEAELFGAKRGAFTGADRDRLGLVRSADGGTLFLDEIGDMPLEAQAKLLRMLQTREVTPLGSHIAEPVDVRVVCATHRPLVRLVREGRFRADLFARISGHTIQLTPLRERKEDIHQLVQRFLGRENAKHLRMTSAFMVGLIGYDWPLNVRELETAIKRAVVLAENGLIDEAQLPPLALEVLREASAVMPETERRKSRTQRTPNVRSNAPPEEELRAVLEKHGGNVAAVARELGKDRVQIHRWLKIYAITLDEFRA